MNTLSKMSLTIVGTAALLLGAPLAANAAVSTPQSTSASQEARAMDAELTFVGGNADGIELHRVPGANATVRGTSQGASDFTQDDGWNQAAQQWTGGNELTIGMFDDLVFTIGDLSFSNGKARGHLIGADLPNSSMDLADANAQVQVRGNSVTVIAKEARGCGEWELHFTMSTQR